MAADIIETITVDRSLESAAALGVIVLVRVALSVTLDMEVDGMMPWRRAEFEATHPQWMNDRRVSSVQFDDCAVVLLRIAVEGDREPVVSQHGDPLGSGRGAVTRRSAARVIGPGRRPAR